MVGWQTAPKAFVSFLGLVELWCLREGLRGAGIAVQHWGPEQCPSQHSNLNSPPAWDPQPQRTVLALQGYFGCALSSFHLGVKWQHLVMQFTDAGPKMEHQHIQACAAEEFSGFLQSSKCHACSAAPGGLAPKPALIPNPLNLHRGACASESWTHGCDKPDLTKSNDLPNLSDRHWPLSPPGQCGWGGGTQLRLWFCCRAFIKAWPWGRKG